jgi:putative hydrolase of the HAD superfamily
MHALAREAIRTCVVFDLDDTLYLERDYVRSGFGAVGQHVRKRFGVDGFCEAAWNRFEAGARGNIFDLAFTDLGVAIQQKALAELVEVYREHHPVISLVPDAQRALSQAAAEVPLALITDGFASCQRNKLAALGIEPVFTSIIVTDELGPQFRKPHPLAFEETERRIGPAKFVYVGDNPAKDFQSPMLMGWTAVRIRRRDGLHFHAEPNGYSPHYEIKTMNELAGLLSEWSK